MKNRNELQKFCYFIDPKFFAERSFFDQILIDVVNFLYSKDKNLLSIHLPQSAGKSYFATLLSSFLIGLLEDVAILRITNKASISETFIQQTSVILRSAEFGAFFPNFKGIENDNKTEIRLKDNWNYSIRGTGADGSTMSLRANLIIIDDLYKSVPDASSARYNKQLQQKWSLEWYGRLEGSNTKVISVGTRYTKNDFYAHLEKIMRPFKTISIPALNEYNESFCEYVRSTEWLMEQKNIIPIDLWNAVFQQNPTAEGMLMIFEDFEPIKKDLTNMNFERVFSVADPSAGVGSDFFACGVFGVIKKTIFLIDLLLERSLEFSEYYNFLKKHNPRLNFIEKNGIGSLILKDAHKQNINIEFAPFISKGEKYARIYSEKERIKNIVFSDKIKEEAFFQLKGYPDIDHDDFPDMLAHATDLLPYYF